jgi:hypothetical protein
VRLIAGHERQRTRYDNYGETFEAIGIHLFRLSRHLKPAFRHVLRDRKT